MNLRQAAHQALEALEWGGGTYDRRNAAITALRAALAEPEQGPVASVTRGKLSMIRGDIITFDGASIPLYAAPTPHKPQTTHWEGCEAVHPECRKPEQEPVAWRYKFARGVRWDFAESDPAEGRDLDVTAEPLYTHPPQRRWVGLTAPEQLECYDLNPARFANNVELKLKEKNT